MEGIDVAEKKKSCEDFRGNDDCVDTAEGLVWERCASVSAGVNKSHKCTYGGLQHDVVRDEDKDEEDECENEDDEDELRRGVPDADVSFKVCERRLERDLLIARLDVVDAGIIMFNGELKCC